MPVPPLPIVYPPELVLIVTFGTVFASYPTPPGGIAPYEG